MPLNNADRLFIAGVGILGGWIVGRTLRRKPKTALDAQLQGLQAALAEIQAEQRQTYQQLEALMSLYTQLDFDAPLPPMRYWAISPDFANILVQTVRAHRPQLVVEASTGVSTLLTAYVLKALGAGRVVSIEENATFAEQSRQQLSRHGVADVAEVIHAPLKPLQMQQATPETDAVWQWYDTDALASLQSIDLLTIDGPSQFYNPQPMARYPALPVFYEYLNAGALILVDDADREHERNALTRWLGEYDLEQVAQHETEKGTVVLRKRG